MQRPSSTNVDVSRARKPTRALQASVPILNHLKIAVRTFFFRSYYCRVVDCAV